MNNKTLATVSIATIVVLLAASYLSFGTGDDEQDENNLPVSEQNYLRVNVIGEYFSLYYDKKLSFGDLIPLNSSGDMQIQIRPNSPTSGTWTGIDDNTALYEVTDILGITDTYRVSFDIKGDTGHTVYAFFQMAILELKFDNTQDVIMTMTQEKLEPIGKPYLE